MRYYIDTAIWIDALEDRRGYHGEQLGALAAKFFGTLWRRGDEIVVSDMVLEELHRHYPETQVRSMLLPFRVAIVRKNEAQHTEALLLAKALAVPVGDALHAVLARDYNCILVTRDKHFLVLRDVSPSYKPEELL